MSPRLLDLITRFAAEVSFDVVMDVINHLGLADKAGSSEAELLILLRRLQPSTREALNELLDTWRSAGGHEPLREVAATLTGALHQANRLKAETRTELVWTGPMSPTGGFRSTEQVLIELCREAREALFIVTFAAYKVPSLVQALSEAAARGIRIVFILESRDESEGKVSFDPALALATTGGVNVETYVWPLDKRERNDRGQYGALHAKFVVADDNALFVSSANLTEYALNLNMELGVLIHGGPAPKQAARNVIDLIQRSVLQRVLPPAPSE